jgi:N-acetylmuramoyl-L-alanine amidase
MPGGGRPLFGRVSGKPTRMRKINLIAVHCSATREGRAFSAESIKAMHTTPKARGGNGWSRVGYHTIIELDGTVVRLLDESRPGIHIRGHNARSLAVCYIGGLAVDGSPKDTRTPAQIRAMTTVLKDWRAAHPEAPMRGHRDMSPDLDGDGVVEKHEWLKACPCFDVVTWCRSVGIDPK